MGTKRRQPTCKKKLKHFFHSKLFHLILGILIMIDLAIVLTDIIVVMIHCYDIPHHLEHILHIMGYLSMLILSIFLVELCLQMYAFGWIEWLKDCLHVFDLFVVSSALIVEILLHDNPAAEGMVGLLVAFRLWRLVRVVHVTTEAIELQMESERDDLLYEIEALEIKIKKIKLQRTNEGSINT